ncbi:hypothetical protein O5833_28260 [Escherichia coli]|nr:hypothetical protein [Escherichia coli]
MHGDAALVEAIRNLDAARSRRATSPLKHW